MPIPGGSPGTVQVDGVTVQVRPVPFAMSTLSEIGGNEWSVHADDTQIVVKDMALSVNGKGFGVLKEGDNVLIDNGVVFVNDQPRAPDG